MGSIPAWAGKPTAHKLFIIAQQVHPRVGGETYRGHAERRIYRGPSPRGRGNHGADRQGNSRIGSIPAWAGKPQALYPSTSPYAVHPRVGGETARSQATVVVTSGPSPRGRGNRGAAPDPGAGQRSIPAWAGKPSAAAASFDVIGVHPRVGGETLPVLRIEREPKGPSPRGRGNQPYNRGMRTLTRSIPAWAGKPGNHDDTAHRIRVHPRVGGETQSRPIPVAVAMGPSPRGRGNRSARGTVPEQMRSIPAWAGKPQGGRNERGQIGVHPRVGGETLSKATSELAATGPSPRGRGNRPPSEREHVTRRSIPAWAGKPRWHRWPCRSRRVHPRVGGETTFTLGNVRARTGPSPRGRGNPGAGLGGGKRFGSIPAWAGKP